MWISFWLLKYAMEIGLLIGMAGTIYLLYWTLTDKLKSKKSKKAIRPKSKKSPEFELPKKYQDLINRFVEAPPKATYSQRSTVEAKIPKTKFFDEIEALSNGLTKNINLFEKQGKIEGFDFILNKEILENQRKFQERRERRKKRKAREKERAEQNYSHAENIDDFAKQFFYGSQRKTKSSGKGLKFKYEKALGLGEGYSFEDVRKAYFIKAKKYHPDRLIDGDETMKKMAEKKMSDINEAYEWFKHNMK